MVYVKHKSWNFAFDITDLEYLKLKVDLGAEYIIANYFYDNEFFFDFVFSQ